MAGSLPLDDGRYLIRSGPAERVLVTETEGALPPARRRRRRPRRAVESSPPVTVSVAVATVILTDQPFEGEAAAESWLGQLDSALTGELIDDALATLDRARAAHAAAAGVPFGTPSEADSIVAARIGCGEGDQVASGRFLQALEVDARGGTGQNRRAHLAQAGSLARTAAILAGREPAAACEVLVPRVTLDLATGNEIAARVAAEAAVGATIAELEFAVDDEGHERDLDRLEELLPALAGISERARRGHADDGDLERVEEAVEVAERVIRRRRILDQ